ncbi:MAG: T9SS C-terminal target domain-containing protein [Ignavibacteriae bacterium]|nr:MAG: T9SS C-terminal target domain-containing protein [Ignavibacteriota bacterium]
MKTILFFLFAVNLSIFAQGNFTIEWTSPVCYNIEFTQAESNNNVCDIIIYQPPYVKVLDGATKVQKRQFDNPDTASFSWNMEFYYIMEFDVNNDGIYEIITRKYNSSTFTYKVLNGASGAVLYQESGSFNGLIYIYDIDGDNYLELITITNPNSVSHQYTMKIISTTAPAPIGVEKNSNTIGQYKLGQNYPNPFNPSTTIEYTISKSANVNINIYNELGQIVKRIDEGNKKSGSYKVMVDCSNLASGVYFYELVSDGIAEAKKMVLVK